MTLRLFKLSQLVGASTHCRYCGSLFITAALSRISHDWVGLPGAARTGLALVVVLSLAVPAWLHDMYRKRKRERLTPKRRVSGDIESKAKSCYGPQCCEH